MLNTKFEMNDGELAVTIEGRIDALTSQEFDKDLEPYLEYAKSVVMDCEGLEYISSGGLRTILAAQQMLEEKGREDIKLIHVNDFVMEILDETGFTLIVQVEQ